MKRRDQQREIVIERLAAYVLAEGLSQTSLRQLADAADVSDRMLLYYFETKSEIITEVLIRISADLAAKLEKAIPQGIEISMAALFEKAAKLTTSSEFAPYMRVSLEIAAASGRGQEPYASVSRQIINGFVEWVEARLRVEDPRQRRAQAAMLIAMIDGLSVLDVAAPKSLGKGAIGEFTALLEG